MMFTDRSDVAVAALQHAFALEREVAEKLLADAPIVVKRAAPPDVAAALFDVLSQLGAQVVLLPSAAAPKSPPPEAPKPPDDAGRGWGGLDLGSEPARAAASSDHASAPEAEFEPAAEPEPQPVAPSAALLPDPDDLFAAPVAEPTAGDEREDSQEFLLGADASDEPPPLEPLQPAGPRASLRTLIGNAVPSLPPLPSQRTMLPSLPSVPRVSARPNAPPPPPERPRGPVMPDLSLDLGPLPPLPNANTVRSLPPPPPPALGAQRPQVSAPPAASRRTPRSEKRAEPPAPPPPPIDAPKKATLGDNYWSARRSIDSPLFAESADAAPVRSASLDRAPAPAAGDPRAAPKPVAVPARAKAAESRSRGAVVLASLEVLAGAIAFGAGIYLDNSVLFGSATPISIALHGLALTSIANGLLGLRPLQLLQLLWLAIACATALGANHVTMTRVPYVRSYGDRTLATGTLTIDDAGTAHEIKLANVRVIAVDVERRIGSALVVRELWLRSPELNGENQLDLELFVEFGRDREVDPQAHSIAAIAQHDLRVLAVGRGTDAHSRARLPGASTAWTVSDGSLRLDQALPENVPGVASWQVEGTVDLTLGDGKDERHLHGKLRAHLVWN